ncbi:MAG: D-Ala-D-Ala carboxypeptidase family metallohydrolase [Prevotella sp.]
MIRQTKQNENTQEMNTTTMTSTPQIVSAQAQMAGGKSTPQIISAQAQLAGGKNTPRIVSAQAQLAEEASTPQIISTPPQLAEEKSTPRIVDDIQLSPHFRLSEMTRSATAIRLNIRNEADALAITNLRLLCRFVLEPLRRRFGVIRITSGFRTKALNEAVGGVEFSQHRFGQAADIYVTNHEVGRKMFFFIKENTPFDQLIYEYRESDASQWLHVSYNIDGGRREAFMNYRMKR